MKEISGFFGQHRFLSNFWLVDVSYKGVTYRTVEHAYQAAKTLIVRERDWVWNQQTPGGAKRVGKNVTLRSDWNSVKLSIMEKLVRQKFTLYPELRNKLLQTGDRQLVERNTWGDRFWGVCNGAGENHLGKILMKIRKELKNERELSGMESG